MIRARSLALDVYYNNAPFAGQVDGEIENLTYVDNAADNSDSIDITLDTQDGKWLWGWSSEKGAALHPRIQEYNQKAQGDRRIIECGLFALDDMSFSDAPTTLRIDSASEPNDNNFSELEREAIWKNASIKRTGEAIAGRYGLTFIYDADDYDIEYDEQDGMDSGYYNQLCKNYDPILRVYARRPWVYDRERYKEKRAVKTFHRTQIRSGSFAYTTTLSGTCTGGYFNYTNADKDIDIMCSIGGETYTKSVNRRATSVYGASTQLCAELNSANHSTVRPRFGIDGDWSVSAGNCINLAGYGKLDGEYFVDRVTHKVSTNGLTTDFGCSDIGTAFHCQDVGRRIKYHGPKGDSGVDYNSACATASPTTNTASSAAGTEAGAPMTLTNMPFCVVNTSVSPACHKNGTYYFYGDILVNGRYRMTNTTTRCGKLPVGKNVAKRVPASYCIAGKEGQPVASTNRTGRVSTIDYETSTYEVAYFDREQSVMRKISATSSGEYKMPMIGQIVNVAHTSSDLAAAMTTGAVWNKADHPAEDFKRLYQKGYSSQKGRAYSRYDENTGVYTQHTDRHAGRTYNGEIFDEAKNPISLVAGGQSQAKNSSASINLNTEAGVGLMTGASVNIEAGSFTSIRATGELNVSIGEKYALTVTKGVEVEVSGGEVRIALNEAVITVTETGDVTVTSPSKIDLSAPEIKAETSAGDVVIQGKNLANHTHEDSLGDGTTSPK